MTFILLPFLVTGLWFEEINVPLVADEAQATESLAGDFRVADIDGDGVPDLLLPDGVYFQRNGSFSAGSRIEMPGASQHAVCDVWKNAIYLRLPTRLQIVQWENGDWKTVLDQAIVWPKNAEETPSDSVSSRAPGVMFGRFASDLDSDGTPELAFPNDDGIHVFARRDGQYTETARLDVYPPLRCVPEERAALWPATARVLVYPTRRMACSYVLDQLRLTVFTRMAAGPGLVQYTIQYLTLDPKAGFGVMPSETRQVITEVMPGFMTPCRLDGDGRLGFIGGDWHETESSPLPTPIYETSVSSDLGRTIQTIRTSSFRPSVSFVDYNGDKRLDMVTHSTGLFRGGIRETVSRFVSSTVIDHEINIHLQDAQGHFASTPTLKTRVAIHLDAPMVAGSQFFQRYLSGEVFDLLGDLNGDGFRDLLVQDQPTRLVVFLGGATSFSSRPDATLPMDEDARFVTADVNGDGKSDIILYEWALNQDPPRMQGRAFLSREGERPQ
jgi:hypothetical protein